MKKEYYFLGIGGAGSNLVEFIYKKGIKGKYQIITYPKRTTLPADIKYIEYKTQGESLMLNDLEIKLSDFSQKVAIPNEVTKTILNGDNLILLAGFGGFTGTLLTRELIDLLKDKGKTFFCLCSTPFHFEGKRRNSFANEMKQKLQNEPNFYCFDLESLRHKNGDLKLSEAFEKADEELYGIIEKKITQ